PAPLPGLDTAHARHLGPKDFEVKSVERNGRDDSAIYVITLRQPVPNGMRVVATLGLSPDPGLQGTVERIEFTTAEAFRPSLLGCGAARVPLSADGTIYDKPAALACKTEATQEQSGDAGGNENADEGDEGGGGTEVDGAIVDNAPPPPAPATSAEKPALGAVREASRAALALSPKREVVVQFTSVLAAVDPLAARNLVRITPAVDGVRTQPVGDELHVTARFKTDTLYQIVLEPAALKDRTGRDLAMKGKSAVWLYWPAEPDFLELAAGSGVVERGGPQTVPVRGRGYSEADVRIHAIDPLDRSFWPFPRQPVRTDDTQRPPSNGEAVAPHDDPEPIQADELTQQIVRLGSPSTSSLLHLPLTPLGPSARFGLDLAPELTRIAGKEKPGTYLVGVKPIDQPAERQWMRLQVTDLSLTAVEEEKSVRFVVTSLADARPVDHAEIRVEGSKNQAWQVLASGVTAADGSYTWPADQVAQDAAIRRIVVIKGDDTLVVDPQQAPDRYGARGWLPGSDGWLNWMTAAVDDRHPKPRTLCHVFTERPIYRPDDPVHIKAYVRRLENGLLTPPGQLANAEIVVTGPDEAEWRYPATVEANGSAHYLFEEKTTATGLYKVQLQIGSATCAAANFKKDAYRLPRFQVRLSGPDKIPLDKPAEIGMTAIYYAGGPAADRPVRWRVTEFPYAFAPKPREGFVYATDTKYEAHVPSEGSAAMEREDKTDAEGRASLPLDPTREKTNAPRRYVVEATVTGDDDKTVTNTQQVLALPAFVLALKAPRYIEKGHSIPVEALMVDPHGKPIAGRSVTLRLLQRQWSSILEASDFSDGKPKYRTEVVDEKRAERAITTGADAVKLDLPITEAGVYVVQIEAQDALGRRQTVSVDLFAGGNQPVTWSRPPAQVFKVTPDKPSYVPGETAKLVLESPFQTARALAIVEGPDGRNSYQWIDVRNGYGEFPLTIEKAHLPRVPVHFALMRGRLKGEAQQGLVDLRRPETIAATAWVGVKPTKNIVTVSVDAPPTAQPGDTVDLVVKLADDTGKPLAGEVTLWLIDQAVLALAQEAPLDPLPGFIRDRGSRLAFSDTRNWPFGLLPLDEDPGGDVGEGDQQLLNKVTIRKNFQPVPYYNPSLVVDASGTVKVSIKLPDDLTIFRIRAKAVSGPDRFGFTTGQIAVRLPVIVEPNLPRFVRPGDQFALAGLGRIVEGGGGPGRVQLKVDGLDVQGPVTSQFDWQPGKSQSFAFPATVPSPGYTEDGKLARTAATVTLAVERTADKARDAFSVELPIRPDRSPSRRVELTDLAAPTPLELKPIDGSARPGTVRRRLIVSAEPALVRLAAGLNYLREYPFGCTEQRLSLARAELAAKEFAAAMGGDGDEHAQRSVTETLNWIPTVTDDAGLIAFWPGTHGSVFLTAWTVEFMVEARKAGFAVDPAQLATLIRSLHQSLRSDYARFVSGAAYLERAWALAALADAGELDRNYATELARKVDQLSLEGVAQVRFALTEGHAVDAPVLQPLDDALWRGLIINQHNGKDVYGGLQEGRYATLSPLILPSETRVLSELLRATAASDDPRRRLVVDALVTLGQGSGWGSTNANAEALL
ncbi:MAG TPA: alpha-2-macroglobulin family protein, partial [Stellaceae bacterium]|nr:alpha-2-macroglobulin family protein [Stellaceae bacterium]